MSFETKSGTKENKRTFKLKFRLPGENKRQRHCTQTHNIENILFFGIHNSCLV